MGTARIESISRLVLVTAGIFGMTSGSLVCSRPADDSDCVEAPQSKTTVVKETHVLKKTHDPGADWCRTCVMGPKGWASCQIVYAEKMGEDRALIKERSRKNACLDAGFKEGECPDKAIKAITCKDDAPPEGIEDPGKVLQDIFYKGKGGAAAAPKADANSSGEVPSEETPK